jgi:hypothetical protein
MSTRPGRATMPPPPSAGVISYTDVIVVAGYNTHYRVAAK